MTSFLQDIRYGVRTLLKTPTFTIVAALVLALGIGANTAIFTVVNTLLLRPLPYPDSSKLVMLYETNPRFQIGVDTLPVTAGNFVDWRDQNTVFEHVCSVGAGRWNLTGGGEPERIAGASVSPDFFRLMKIEPILGRTFLEDEDQEGKDKVLVLGQALWLKRFGGDPNIIGKTISIDDESYSVIGIAPEGFQFPRRGEVPWFTGVTDQTELWRPMPFGKDLITKSRANHQLSVIARLKPELTRERAQAEMSSLATRLEQAYPESNQDIGVKVVSLNEQVVGNLRTAMLVLMGAVALVLLIACANVANLLLARSSARQKEIAIRTALGASRGRIVRQLLVEALLLSATGGVTGSLLSMWATQGLLLVAGNLPRVREIGIDLTVLGFIAAVVLLTTMLFGLSPALQVSRINISDALKEGSLTSGGSRFQFRNVMVIAEIALSIVLLVGAGLMIKSLARVLGVDTGFRSKNTLTVQLSLLNSKYPKPAQQINFFDRVSAGVTNLPGVQSVGLISSAPLSGGIYAGGFSIEGSDAADRDDLVSDRRMIGSEYFSTLGIPIVSGRAFSDRDNQSSEGVAIVSEAWARRYLHGDDPLTKRVKLGGRDSNRPWLTVVGVAGDVRDSALEQDARPCIYLPYSQFPSSSMTLVVRSASDPMLLVGGIREAVWAIDKDQPVTDVKTLDQYVSAAVSSRRFSAILLGSFAGLALVLASIGVYGVISFAVSKQTRDIGIRVALGAQPADVMKLIIGRGMLLVLAGVAIGTLASLGLTRALASLVFGVSTTDPVIYVGVSVLLTALALVACYLPARRALRVDPLVALRCE
jgi:putative ABC transport system permease protein